MVYNRLKSQSGATVLIALVFFMLCAVVGSVILAAGSASAGRIAGLVNQEQAYYTVSSASQVIKNEIKDCVFTRSKAEPADKFTGELISENPQGDLGNLLTLAAQSIFNGSESYEDTLTIKCNEDEAFDIVYGDFTMDNAYAIKIKLHFDKDGDNANTYAMVVTAKPLIDTTNDSFTYEVVSGEGENQVKEIMTGITQTIKVKWSDINIEKG